MAINQNDKEMETKSIIGAALVLLMLSVFTAVSWYHTCKISCEEFSDFDYTCPICNCGLDQCDFKTNEKSSMAIYKCQNGHRFWLLSDGTKMQFIEEKLKCPTQ